GHTVIRLPIVLGTHHTGPRGSLKELSRRYRDNLIKGYGQVLRLALRQGTFRRHVQRMKRYLQFQAAMALALLALGAGAVLREWRRRAVWAAGAAAGIVLFMLRGRSLTKPFRLIAEWAMWTPPMLVGFFERPRDPRELQPAHVIARQIDCRVAAQATARSAREAQLG